MRVPVKIIFQSRDGLSLTVLDKIEQGERPARELVRPLRSGFHPTKPEDFQHSSPAVNIPARVYQLRSYRVSPEPCAVDSFAVYVEVDPT